MASTDVQTVNVGLDRFKLGLALLLVVGAVAGFYLLGRQPAWVQWLIFAGGLIAAAFVFLLTSSGRSLMDFGRDAWRELRKVVWPERKEALQITAYVFAFVVVMALFLWLTDKSLEWLFYDLILGWKK